MHPPISTVKWKETYRLVNSCYPPCDIWEDIISQSDDWQIAFELEAMSNPRVRQEIGDISIIPKDKMITGKNSWWVISAFTHTKAGRFNNDHFGAYYAANNFLTALKEKAYGLTKQFMEATNEPIADITCRVFLGKIDSKLHDIRDVDSWKNCYTENDYTHSQELATILRGIESNGIVYKSVRDSGGECIAAFWPDIVSIPIQERHTVLHWNGKDISSYFEVREKNHNRISLK
jgi:RES domain-containing protein